MNQNAMEPTPALEELTSAEIDQVSGGTGAPVYIVKPEINLSWDWT
jgi:hypothetical protein